MGEKRTQEQQKLERLPSCLTYAALVDARNTETVITELMIRRACREMEVLQQFPFASKVRRAAPQRR